MVSPEGSTRGELAPPPPPPQPALAPPNHDKIKKALENLILPILGTHRLVVAIKTSKTISLLLINFLRGLLGLNSLS
jgi:hypothetical protein